MLLINIVLLQNGLFLRPWRLNHDGRRVNLSSSSLESSLLLGVVPEPAGDELVDADWPGEVPEPASGPAAAAAAGIEPSCGAAGGTDGGVNIEVEVAVECCAAVDV